MKSYFSSDFFAGNRLKLRELFTGTAPIVITANGLMQRGADSAYGFAQDANFWYLTGIDEPDIILVMEKDKDYLIVPGRSAVREAFDGSIGYDDLAHRSGIKTVLQASEGWQQLISRLKKVQHVATLTPAPAYIEHFGLYTNPARTALVQQLKTAKADIELLDLLPHLIQLRMVKQTPEVVAIQAAIDVTIASIRETATTAKLRTYAWEYELEAEISRGFRKRGAAGHAFEPIVASGSRACTLHNVANNGELVAGELVLMDVGAEVEHYAADISRTVSLGEPSRRQQAVHQAVADVQQYAFSLLKPGVLLKDYEGQVEHFLGEKLRELGLIKNVEHDNIRRFCPHSVSHYLGLNVHDAGDYQLPLETGVVMTAEPGIYIPEEGIGVRIEDDVLITADGCQILSDKLSRKLH